MGRSHGSDDDAYKYEEDDEDDEEHCCDDGEDDNDGAHFKAAFALCCVNLADGNMAVLNVDGVTHKFTMYMIGYFKLQKRVIYFESYNRMFVLYSMSE